MATVYKVLGQTYPSANTNTTLYSVPSATSSVVSTINVCNQSSDADAIDIIVRPAGASLANQHYLFRGMSVGANGNLSITCGITLAATDVITVRSTLGTTSFAAFGSEIS